LPAAGTIDALASQAKRFDRTLEIPVPGNQYRHVVQRLGCQHIDHDFHVQVAFIDVLFNTGS
jgi:hypothetical protein